MPSDSHHALFARPSGFAFLHFGFPNLRLRPFSSAFSFSRGGVFPGQGSLRPTLTLPFSPFLHTVHIPSTLLVIFLLTFVTSVISHLHAMDSFPHSPSLCQPVVIHVLVLYTYMLIYGLLLCLPSRAPDRLSPHFLSPVLSLCPRSPLGRFVVVCRLRCICMSVGLCAGAGGWWATFRLAPAACSFGTSFELYFAVRLCLHSGCRPALPPFWFLVTSMPTIAVFGALLPAYGRCSAFRLSPCFTRSWSPASTFTHGCPSPTSPFLSFPTFFTPACVLGCSSPAGFSGLLLRSVTVWPCPSPRTGFRRQFAAFSGTTSLRLGSPLGHHPSFFGPSGRCCQ